MKDVVEGSESEEYCEEFLFFTDSFDRRRRRIFAANLTTRADPKKNDVIKKNHNLI